MKALTAMLLWLSLARKPS